MSSDLFVIVRTLGEAPELLAAYSDRATAENAAHELGAGHHVSPVRHAPSDTGHVAHVWECRATVTDDRYAVEEPARLAGASRIVLDTSDMPAENVYVDEQAANLEAAVHGHRVHYVRAYAARADRARELAEGKARSLADTQPNV
ncbi:hypothetical protein H0B56_12170 [Haloechinothrix sp. YIM 98757]|uniref:Uncharacterized protein n=1 Tax=Haloechinothrix aidingensis TaxID=2752311 RepID=A0A838AAQ2_9PSEU|nr:hypothetical protein [Haloechinothrix aidingensis]MBA0126298.1 hypothetical protein [Haloechinothrix aidingensis]